MTNRTRGPGFQDTHFQLRQAPDQCTSAPKVPEARKQASSIGFWAQSQEGTSPPKHFETSRRGIQPGCHAVSFVGCMKKSWWLGREPIPGVFGMGKPVAGRVIGTGNEDTTPPHPTQSTGLQIVRPELSHRAAPAGCWALVGRPDGGPRARAMALLGESRTLTSLALNLRDNHLRAAGAEALATLKASPPGPPPPPQDQGDRIPVPPPWEVALMALTVASRPHSHWEVWGKCEKQLGESVRGSVGRQWGRAGY